MKSKFLMMIFLPVTFALTSFSQEMSGVKVTDAGTFEGSINGKSFTFLFTFSISLIIPLFIFDK